MLGFKLFGTFQDAYGTQIVITAFAKDPVDTVLNHTNSVL
jgi:hypothetical protein